VLLLAGGWTAAFAFGTFASHMTAHVIAVAVAAPLLAVTLNCRPALLGVPMATLMACGVELVVVWGWHVPRLHAAAAHSIVVFAAEQLCFLLAGYAVWASALPAAPRGRQSALPGVGALLITSMHMTLLGGLLAVSSRAWYHHHEATNALWDQHLGGVIMLAVGGMAYLGGALVLLARALSQRSGWRPAP